MEIAVSENCCEEKLLWMRMVVNGDGCEQGSCEWKWLWVRMVVNEWIMVQKGNGWEWEWLWIDMVVNENGCEQN